MSKVKRCGCIGCNNYENNSFCKVREIEEETALYLTERYDIFDKDKEHICDMCIGRINEMIAFEDYPLLILDHMGRAWKNPLFIPKIPTLRREDV